MVPPIPAELLFHPYPFPQKFLSSPAWSLRFTLHSHGSLSVHPTVGIQTKLPVESAFIAWSAPYTSRQRYIPLRVPWGLFPSTGGIPWEPHNIIFHPLSPNHVGFYYEPSTPTVVQGSHQSTDWVGWKLLDGGFSEIKKALYITVMYITRQLLRRLISNVTCNYMGSLDRQILLCFILTVLVRLDNIWSDQEVLYNFKAPLLGSRSKDCKVIHSAHSTNTIWYDRKINANDELHQA